MLVWTNDSHHLFYKSIYFRGDAPTPLVDIVMGPWYIVQGSLTFGCMLAGMCLILWRWGGADAAGLSAADADYFFVGQFLPALGGPSSI
ncbi:histidine kinase N-terminal 7TM domain-containing protein [Paenibacillus rhizoplanae]